MSSNGLSTQQPHESADEPHTTGVNIAPETKHDPTAVSTESGGSQQANSETGVADAAATFSTLNIAEVSETGPADESATLQEEKKAASSPNEHTQDAQLEASGVEEKVQHDNTQTREATRSPSPPAPLPKDEKFLARPTATPDDVSRASSKERRAYSPAKPAEGQMAFDMEFDEKQRKEAGEESRPEIQTIMSQFKDNEGASASELAISPTESNLPVFHYPPRSSSLEHFTQQQQPEGQQSQVLLEKVNSTGKSPARRDSDSFSFSKQPSISSQPPPPEPDPEPALAFDFHRFLEQLRHRTADPVAKFLRSFLLEFGKRQWQVHEQVKLISDFLAFIANRMSHCEVWRTLPDAEFDNAREGMEKLVMNRLYSQTFSPEIPPGESSPSRNKRRSGNATFSGPGRKGQHQEDVERDQVLAQKVRIYGWIKEEHLDIKPADEKGKKFLKLAQQELSKIKSYRAPRDKVICVLNSCKIIFGYLRNSHADQSADAFIPLLIFTVLKANPDHLVSNVQYILRFRNQEKLTGEAGYYMSSLMGAVQFIENLDRTNLTISDEEFEKNVEAAVSAIAERHEQDEKRQASSSSHPRFNEKSALSRPEVTPRHSQEGERAVVRRANRHEASISEKDEDQAAVSGLLRTIQKPLSSIGRMFSEEDQPPTPPSRPLDRPPPPRLDKKPAVPGQTVQPQQYSPAGQPTAPASGQQAPAPAPSDQMRAAQRDSAEAAEAQRIHRAEQQTVVETLSGMFPDLDQEVISDVVREKEGRIGLAVDACLALSR